MQKKYTFEYSIDIPKEGGIIRKAVILPILFILLLPILFSYNNNNPYSGKYTLESDLGTILEIKKNNTFNLEINFGKNSNTITGKYSIIDNNISLEYAGHYDIYTNGIVSGKVEGSIITFHDKNGQMVVFKKE